MEEVNVASGSISWTTQNITQGTCCKIKVNFEVLHLKDVTIVTNALCTQLSSKVLPLQDQNSFYTIYDLLDHSLWEWLKESRGN